MTVFTHCFRMLPRHVVESLSCWFDGRNAEERRSMPKEEKQRLKDLSKKKQMYQRKKRMKRQQDIEIILEEFKGVRNIPRIKTAKKRVLIKKKKERMR